MTRSRELNGTGASGVFSESRFWNCRIVKVVNSALHHSGNGLRKELVTAPAQRSSPSKFRIPTGLKLVETGFAAWTIGVFLFLYLPIFLLIAYSFNDSKLNVIWEGFTFKWYSLLWQNAPLVRALNNSLIIAAATTAISVPLGTLGAWLLYRYRFPFPRIINTLVLSP